MKDKCLTIDAKVEVISAFWGKLIFKWYMKAKDENDLGMLNIISEINQVPAHVRLFLLRKYVLACKFRHAIAFIQWRLHFSENRRNNTSTTQMDDQEVEELIE